MGVVLGAKAYRERRSIESVKFLFLLEMGLLSGPGSKLKFLLQYPSFEGFFFIFDNFLHINVVFALTS